jgi:glycosyltransferase involved in cell wall biosynthesis
VSAVIDITYDFQIFIDQFYGGISRYFWELASRVNALEGFSSKILAPFYKNRYVRSDEGIVRGIRLPAKPRNRQIYRDMNWIASPFVNKFATTDILHETYYQRRPVLIQRKASVLTVYDMIHERFRNFFSANDNTSSLKKAALARADHIICISESTRRDLFRYFEVPESKTSVIHLGFNVTSEQSAIPPELQSRAFILYVGNRQGYKNFDALLRAYASSRRLMNDHLVACFGGGPFSRSEHLLFKELGLTNDRIVRLEGSDELLHALYRRAAFFVCCSLYEGFGITVLEAMSAGCPVACSNTSSLPEVAGDAAQFFDPQDTDSIRYALELLSESEPTRSALSGKGRERTRLFSWNKCAAETAALYHKILGR